MKILSVSESNVPYGFHCDDCDHCSMSSLEDAIGDVTFNYYCGWFKKN